MMTEEARKAQREYQRQWRKANPEKVRAKNERYWVRRVERMQKEAAAQQEGTTE